MCTEPSNESPPPDDKVNNPRPTLIQLFSRYPIQTSIMQNLNFYYFRNLQLAGCQVLATSRAIQGKYLIPIHCNQTEYDTIESSSVVKTPRMGMRRNHARGSFCAQVTLELSMTAFITRASGFVMNADIKVKSVTNILEYSGRHLAQTFAKCIVSRSLSDFHKTDAVVGPPRAETGERKLELKG